MKVLLALEANASCEEIARAAAARPWPSRSSFCLLNVVDPYPLPLVDVAKKEARMSLGKAAAHLIAAGWPAEIEVIIGSPRRSILRLAKDWQADLVMMGSHGLSAAQRLLLGSTAQSVLRHAPCSVEIVRVRPGEDKTVRERPMRILVATDGSECSMAALRSVANRPWPKGSTVRVISVPEFILLKDFSYLDTHQIENFHELVDASIADAKVCIGKAAEIFSGSALNLCSDVPTFEDRPCQVILHEAESWQADLIVVGSHGRSGFDRVVMGSVSEAVALHAKCSVEVARAPAAA